jgi:hypothetical protein
MSMIEELRAALQSVPDGRVVIVCHPEDETTVRLLVGACTVVAPRIEVSRWAQAGEPTVFPDPSAPQTIVP